MKTFPVLSPYATTFFHLWARSAGFNSLLAGELGSLRDLKRKLSSLDLFFPYGSVNPFSSHRRLKVYT